MICLSQVGARHLLSGRAGRNGEKRATQEQKKAASGVGNGKRRLSCSFSSIYCAADVAATPAAVSHRKRIAVTILSEERQQHIR